MDFDAGLYTKFDIVNPPDENKKIDELTDEQIRIAYFEFGFDLPKTIKPTGLDYYKNSSERTGYTIIRLYFNDQSDVQPFLSSCGYVGKEYDAHGGTKQCVISKNGEFIWIWRSNNSIFLEKFDILTQNFQNIMNDKNVINKNQ